MKRVPALFIALSLLSSTSAAASVADKKAKAVVATKTTALTKSIKEACGNRTLKVSVDWSVIENYAELPFGSTQASVMTEFGERVENTAQNFVVLCKRDELYKMEIKKITKIVFSATSSVHSHTEELKYVRKGKKVSITLRPMSDDSHRHMKALEKLF